MILGDAHNILWSCLFIAFRCLVKLSIKPVEGEERRERERDGLVMRA